MVLALPPRGHLSHRVQRARSLQKARGLSGRGVLNFVKQGSPPSSQCGSNRRFTERIASISSTVYCIASRFAFRFPSPCSAETVPPNCTAWRANSVISAFARSDFFARGGRMFT